MDNHVKEEICLRKMKDVLKDQLNRIKIEEVEISNSSPPQFMQQFCNK